MRLWVGLFRMQYPERYSKLSLRFAYTFKILDQIGSDHYIHSGHVRLLGPEYCALHSLPISDTWVSEDAIIIQVTIDTVSWEDHGRLDAEESSGEEEGEETNGSHSSDYWSNSSRSEDDDSMEE